MFSTQCAAVQAADHVAHVVPDDHSTPETRHPFLAVLEAHGAGAIWKAISLSADLVVAAVTVEGDLDPPPGS